MEWQDEAFVLSARAHGESGAIVHLLTRTRGRYAAHVAGGASRRMRPWLQPGARVEASFRAKSAEQLGSARLEPVGEGPAVLFDDRLALAGVSAGAAVAQGALPEREPHPSAFEAFAALVSVLEVPEIWPAVYVRFELGLLEELGFGLDLTRCAATGAGEDLVYVSPRTGRAVSRTAGLPYAGRLLALPPFLATPPGPLRPGDVAAGFGLTGHFLAVNVFEPMDRPLPAARTWLLDLLRDADRL